MARWGEHFEVLSGARYPALLAYATLLTGQRATAEDVVQDALVATFGRPRRLPTVGHAEAYARRAILSRFLDGQRRRATLARALSRSVERDESPDAAVDVAERDRVVAALAVLSPRERACVVLRFYDDLEVAEVAHRLGVAVGTVKRYLADASEKLRGELGEVRLDTDDASVAVVTHGRGARSARRVS